MAPPVKKKKPNQPGGDFDEVAAKKGKIDAQFGKMNATSRQVGQPPSPSKPPSIPKGPSSSPAPRKAAAPSRPIGRNPNVGYAANDSISRALSPKTAGHALDPISNEPMLKGSPVAPLSMSKAAQTGRRIGDSLDDAIAAPFQKPAKRAKKVVRTKMGD